MTDRLDDSGDEYEDGDDDVDRDVTRELSALLRIGIVELAEIIGGRWRWCPDLEHTPFRNLPPARVRFIFGEPPQVKVENRGRR